MHATLRGSVNSIFTVFWLAGNTIGIFNFG